MFLTIVISHSPVKGGSGMRSPHLTSLWPHLFTPFAQKMTEVLPIGFLEIEVTIEAGGNHKERHFQFKALRGDRMNRLRQELFDQAPSCLNSFTMVALDKRDRRWQRSF